MTRLLSLLLLFTPLAAFASFFSRREAKPPSRVARLALAVMLYAALVAIEWFCCFKDDSILCIDWKASVLWPFIAVPGMWHEMSRGFIACLEVLLFSIPVVFLLPFWLIYRGVQKQSGKWLPYLLFGVLFLQWGGCANSVQGI